MARSRRYTPIASITTAASEKQDKRWANYCAAIKVRTPDNQGEKVFCRLRRREGEARPEAQAADHLA